MSHSGGSSPLLENELVVNGKWEEDKTSTAAISLSAPNGPATPDVGAMYSAPS